MLSVPDAIRRNRILSGLPERERELILQDLAVIPVHLGDVLDRADEKIQYLSFPVDAAISMMDSKDKHHTLDVALIGAKGLPDLRPSPGIIYC